jgi:electron transport complex protein RnfD
MLFTGQVIFAIGCGVIVAVVRMTKAYPEGVTFAILLMNILTPLIDRMTSRKVYGTVKQHA